MLNSIVNKISSYPLALVFIVLVQSAFASPVSNNSTTDWNTASGWTPSGVPNLVIWNGSQHAVVSHNKTSGSLIIKNGNSIRVTSGAILTINGNLTLGYSSSLTVDIGATLIITGSLLATNSPSTITIDGVLRNMPYTQSYWAGDTIFLSAIIQPNWLFNKWSTYSNSILPSSTFLNSYFIASASDSCVLQTYPKPPLTAFISGNDTICNNQKEMSQIKISFTSGTEPFTFEYSIDGVTQPSITTDLNPYIIYTNQSGFYSLESFSDALEIGSISGSALIVVNDAPEAIFSSSSDTLSILYPTIQLTDQSIGYITSWAWDFGDNSTIESIPNPVHNYNDEYGIYQISLIVEDNNSCTDTSIRQVWVTDEYWMYIPNSFSPDYDGVNDLFCIYYNGVRAETFLFNIYDRFSSLVYSTDNINDLECLLNTNGWNGKHQKDGTPLPTGTYVYEMYLQDFEGWKHKEYGQIFIVR